MAASTRSASSQLAVSTPSLKTSISADRSASVCSIAAANDASITDVLPCTSRPRTISRTFAVSFVSADRSTTTCENVTSATRSRGFRRPINVSVA